MNKFTLSIRGRSLQGQFYGNASRFSLKPLLHRADFSVLAQIFLLNSVD
ncbi:MAG: hypothetical protein F6K32_25670 [Desertifilum sp. SIO1I2]|nr:hypothetical protein [Desertifilum sp. SIO1I2]